MEQWIRYAIDVILVLFGILAGRFWEHNDRQLKKDKEQIDKIIGIIPIESESLRFLRQHDFSNGYRKGQTESFWELRRLLRQPSYFL